MIVRKIGNSVHGNSGMFVSCLFFHSSSESRTLVNDLDLMKGLCHYMASLRTLIMVLE